jgi:NAD(P)-dependent dehydrogenase (short-subunit alcohol dehydrogenase family)
MSDIDFTGQVAIVTGAGSGIGRATALLLGARGARVLVVDPATDGRGQAVADEIGGAGGQAVADITAVGTREAALAITARALDAFGRVDVLINNAGIAKPGAFDAVADEDIDRVMAVNLMGPYALMRAVWPVMRAQAYGRIVNLASSAALGSGISGPYAVSKAGVIGLTKDAGIAGEPLGILVNAVMPSAHTPLIDNHPDPAFRAWMKTCLPAERVAAAIVFLASLEMDRSAEIFTAGGGLVTRMAFQQSKGWFDPALAPEGVRDNFNAIFDLDGAAPVSTQDDHQRIYDTLFPGRPGT